MERIKKIMDFRKSCNLPRGFEEQWPNVSKVLHLCCAQDPTDRPTASELLASSHLPSKFEIEEEYLKEALAITCNPRTESFKKLVSGMFEQPVQQHMEFSYSQPLRNFIDEAQDTDNMRRIIMHIFYLHNATFLGAPLLRPKTGFFDPGHLSTRNQAVELLDKRHGAIVSLPVELSTSFARVMAHLQVPRYKRCHFGKVYSDAPNPDISQPSERIEATFDILDNRVSACPFLAAEAVAVGRDIALAIAPFCENGKASRICVRLNHTKLSLAILDLCGINAEYGSRDIIRSFSRLTPRIGARVLSNADTIAAAHATVARQCRTYDNVVVK